MLTELNPNRETTPSQSASPPRGHESGAKTVDTDQLPGCPADIAPYRETLRKHFDTALAEIAALRSLEPEHSGYARQTWATICGDSPMSVFANFRQNDA